LLRLFSLPRDKICVFPYRRDSSGIENEKIVVIKNVPVEVFADGGEASMKSFVVGEIGRTIDCLVEMHSEVSSIHYKAV
jgi:hypothetical protein